MKKYFVLGLAVFLISVSKAKAETNAAQMQILMQHIKTVEASLADLRHLVAEQGIRINFLENENQKLKAKTSPTIEAMGASITKSPNYLPEIGMLADFVASSSESNEDTEGNDRLSVREIEITIGHDIDPYSRLDSSITFSDFEEVGIEEAYLSYWDLPADFKLRIGRMRPHIGIASALHRDQLDTVDEPLVIQSYLGVEGLFKTGLELSNYLPLPWTNVTHEAFVGVIEGGAGEDGTIFGDSRRNASIYGRLKNFWEISDFSGSEFGISYLAGSADEDDQFEARALVLDISWQHNFNSLNKLKIQSEGYFQDRSIGFLEAEDEHSLGENSEEMKFWRHPFGMYSLVDYRLSEKFNLGMRWDYVQPINVSETELRSYDQAFSSYISFHQSEFARWRFQYQHVDFADGGNDERFWLQATVAIGVHEHQPQ